jgi:hypothetical protein
MTRSAHCNIDPGVRKTTGAGSWRATPCTMPARVVFAVKSAAQKIGWELGSVFIQDGMS